MAEKLGEPEIVHEPGSFDEFLLSFYWEFDGKEVKWSPQNEAIFEMLEMWFESEDEGYEGEDEYGSMYQLFFIMLTQYEGREAAVKNNSMSGGEALEHFLKHVAEHGDEIVENLEKTVEQAKEEYENWD